MTQIHSFPQQRAGLLAIAFMLLAMLPASALAQADACIGYWKTVDDETGRVKSVVQIYKSGSKYFGKVVKLYREPNEDQDPVCSECDSDDSRYNKRVLGMIILTDLVWEASDSEWDDGEILDPKNGSVYDCYLKLEGNDKMMVRGYLGFSVLGRTQYWYRVDKPE